MIKNRIRVSRRRKTRKAPPLTEFDKPGKRRDFTVFLVEDDEDIRAALVDALRERKVKAEGYMTAMEFYRDYRESVPGVLVLDIRLPGISGIELQERLQQEDFPLPIVMVSGHADVPTAVKAMKDGAFDFLAKPVRFEDLVAAVSRAYHYYYEIDVDVDDELDEIEDSLSRLTVREREVLDRVTDGLSSREIADSLGISTKTVEAHRSRINDKMRSENVAHLIRMCFLYKAAEAQEE